MGDVAGPLELRVLTARKPGVLTAMGRILAEENAGPIKRLSDARGGRLLLDGETDFDGSLNLQVHFRTLEVDSVIYKHDGLSLLRIGSRCNTLPHWRAR